MNKRFLKMVSMYLVASILAESVFAYAGEARHVEATAEEIPILTTESEAESEQEANYFPSFFEICENFKAKPDEETYDTDFDGLSGNYLLAINPDPWRTSITDTENNDYKQKHLGFSPDIKEASRRIHRSVKNTAMLKTAEESEHRVSLQNEDKTEHNVGEVIVKQVYIGYAGAPGIDYVSGNMGFTARVYQCLYIGELSTIWGSVPLDQLNDTEKKALKDVDEDMKDMKYPPQGNPFCNPELQGEICSSDNKYRTCVSKDTIERIEDLGKNLDELIKKEGNYTGDYLEMDRKYGDRDGKIAFYFEPIEEYEGQWNTAGYFSEFDTMYKYSGNGVMDGMHMNVKILSMNTLEEISFLAFHEVQHLIFFGYTGMNEENESSMCDSWINEWTAQTVAMLASGSWDNYTEGYCNLVSHLSTNTGVLCYPYAYGEDYSMDDAAKYNIYAISPALAQYFMEHVDEEFVKTFMTSVNKPVTADSISEYLKDKTSHTLSWWLSAFSIALFSGVDGTDPDVERGSEFDAGTSGAVVYTRKHLREKYDYWNEHSDADPFAEVYKYPIIENISTLSENHVILGGGTVVAFRTDEDRTWNIKDIGKGVVWALRDSKGKIVSVKGLEYVDGLEKESENKKQETPVRNPDGSWDYSDDQEEKLSQIMRPAESLTIEGVNKELVMSLTAREAISFNPDKKALEASILDKEKSIISINGTQIPIKKVVIKNPKKAYISENSIFANTVSDNNKAAYAKFKDKKKPGYYLVLDTKGLSGDIKKAAKKANKQMKKNPFYLEIIPVNLTSSNFTVDKFNNKKQIVKKAAVKFDGGASSKIKYNGAGKKDFTSEKSGELVIVTGTNNYNGQVSYDPSTKTINVK